MTNSVSVEAMAAALSDTVVRGDLAGAAMRTWRPGDAMRTVAVGRRDVDRDLPVTRDTIFRIASLTKPVTTVAALALLEEGRFGLDDPITRLAPELANLRVLVDAEGPLNRVRILRPETCARMMTNQLTPAQRRAARMLGQAMFAEGHGHGMGVAVVMEPDKADPLRCRGGLGTVGWPGAYGSWWQADPNDRSVLVFLSHHMVDLPQMAQGIGLGVWSAIGTFHRLAHA
jgi:CubicO group peptidase (beta-lactamase class C family)